MKKILNILFNKIKYYKFSSLFLFFSYYLRKTSRHITFNKSDFFCSENFKINKEDGYKILNYENLSSFKDMLLAINKNLANNFYFNNLINNSKKDFMNINPIDLSKKEHSSLIKFIKNSEIINSIADYINAPPILLSSQIWKSKKNEVSSNFTHSQLYHFDREDWRQIKCFIPIKKIDINSGPLNIINAKNTKLFKFKSLTKFRIPNSKSRYDDKFVNKLIETPPIPLIADVGDLILVDTSQCLHYGSRVNTNERLVIVLQFVSPYSPKLDKIKIKKLNEFYDIRDFSLQLV
jgi:hypothetical protein